MGKEEQTESQRISLAEQANATGAAILGLMSKLDGQPKGVFSFSNRYIGLRRFPASTYSHRFGVSRFDKGASLDDYSGIKMTIDGPGMEDIEFTLYKNPDGTPVVIEISQGVKGKERKKHLIWDARRELWTAGMNGHRPEDKPSSESELFEKAVKITTEIEEFLD